MTEKLPHEALSLSPYTTRYGLAIPPASLSPTDWQELMGLLRESGERVHFYKADMLYYAQQNLVVNKHNDKIIRRRQLWQEVYTPEEAQVFTPEQREEMNHFRRINVPELATLSNLATSTIYNYLKVVKIWTLERRAEFDLSVMNFSDFEAACSQSIQDVTYEQQRAILKATEARRIQLLQERDASTTENLLPKTSTVRLQAQAVKQAKSTGASSNGHTLTFYPDQRFSRPLVSKEELTGLLGEQVGKLPDGADVVGYSVEIKIWAIREEETDGDTE